MNVRNIDLNKESAKIRCDIIQTAYDTKNVHIGSCLSCTDILTALYFNILSIQPKNPSWENRDIVILSKGHAALAWDVVLAHRGYYPLDELKKFTKLGSAFTIHPTRGNLPGIEVTAGSLGHGLGIGAGLAFGAKKTGNPSRTFVILGDGEINEGEIWESALFAAMHKLDNLIAIVDYNGLQGCGFTKDVLDLKSIRDKFISFGWDAYDIDGNNITEIITTINGRQGRCGKPLAIVAHTIKGKGVSFMENNNEWHYLVPTKTDLEKAITELMNQ